METSTPTDSPPDPATRTSGKAALAPRPDRRLAPSAIFACDGRIEGDGAEVVQSFFDHAWGRRRGVVNREKRGLLIYRMAHLNLCSPKATLTAVQCYFDAPELQ